MTGNGELQCTAATECSAVFDLKWQPQQHPPQSASGSAAGCQVPRGVSQEEDPSTAAGSGASTGAIAATALADGSCTLMRVQQSSIEWLESASEAACGGMALSCDWDSKAHDAVFCSSSNGQVSCCKIREGALCVDDSWAAHAMEVWMVSCDKHKVRGCTVCCGQTRLPA